VLDMDILLILGIIALWALAALLTAGLERL
jgi:hypothetical protein